jgi:protein transport protein SEC61 subunit gamma and related proteins
VLYLEENENEKTGIKAAVSGFLSSARRIFTVSKKPDNEEYKQMVKVTGIGIILLGVIGALVILAFLIIGMGK